MSMKVYSAYKLKSEVTDDHAKFWAWVRKTIHRGEREVTKVLRNLYGTMSEEILEDGNEQFQELLKLFEDNYSARLAFCNRKLTQLYKASSLSSERNTFDFDVSIAIREMDGDLYLIPYADMLVKHTLDFLKRDRCLEDFCYWNNTDPPDGMHKGEGYKRWEARGRIWDKIDQRGWRDYLVVEVCSYAKFSNVDPYMAMRHEHLLEKKKAALDTQFCP